MCSAHLDASARHITFRILGHVLRLAPSVLRLQFLREGSSPYMRTAAIRLEKKLFWKRFQIRKRSVCFGSLFLLHRMYFALMGPWKLEPPNLLASISEVDALKKSPEPLRLVGCLNLYHIPLRLRNGVRDWLRW